MSSHRLAAAVLALTVLVSTQARAQEAGRVVVLEFDKDPRGVVRTQVVDALNDAKQVEVLSLGKWEDAADRKKLLPTAYTEAATIAALSPELGLNAIVAGELGDRFTIRIFDFKGEQVWTKELPLARGRLSGDNARRLASAIAAASTASKASQPATAPTTETGTTATGTGTGTGTGSDVTAVTPPGTDTATGTGSTQTTVPPTVAVAPAVTAPAPSRGGAIGPPLFAGRVSGTTTWRSYCSRPGVNSCKQWDDLPDGTEPTGETVTFTSSVPYAGYHLTAEVFPLAGMSGWWNGFGLGGTFGHAFSLTTVRISTPNSTTPDRTVTSIDLSWSAAAMYRFYFPLGGLAGFVGAHAGYRARAFNVDPTTLLGGSDRRYPTFGIDARLPLAKLAQVELAGSYFLNPRAGEEELSKYGTSTRGAGFTASAGLSGDVWGPLGYAVRFSYEGFWDEFTGAGTRWQNGGVAQETYATLTWGVTAAW